MIVLWHAACSSVRMDTAMHEYALARLGDMDIVLSAVDRRATI